MICVPIKANTKELVKVFKKIYRQNCRIEGRVDGQAELEKMQKNEIERHALEMDRMMKELRQGKSACLYESNFIERAWGWLKENFIITMVVIYTGVIVAISIAYFLHGMGVI